MKYTLSILLCSIVISTSWSQNSDNTRITYAETINVEDLKTHLYQFASDTMQGRMTGTEGQKKAADYLRRFYIKNGISAPDKDSDYFQPIPADYFSRMKSPKPSENVVAFIEGSEFPEEIIVLSAHYDHVGTRDGEVYNGADDDGSGTVTLLEIAEAFKMAKDNGQGPKRSLLFLHVTGEEIGLYGSKYYTENLTQKERKNCCINT